MGGTIAYVGVPTSLGSYGPGQEKAPQAFRAQASRRCFGREA
jgi:arginase family enzyme